MNLEAEIIVFLHENPQMKASKIAQILNMSKKEVNQVLHRMKKSGECIHNENYFWSLSKNYISQPNDMPNNSSIRNIIGQPNKDITGIIVGYDPGGNNSNGIAVIEIVNSRPENIIIETFENVESVIQKIVNCDNLIGVGVDTLSCWCTGKSGWRPADLWLRKKYPQIKNSIMSPNTLSGSMGLNGMSVLVEISSLSQNIVLSETHPKVIYFALSNKKYSYSQHREMMDDFLSEKNRFKYKNIK